MANELPKEAPNMPTSCKHLRALNVLHILAFSRPMAVRGPAMAPRLPKGPKGAEGPRERPTRAPIRPQELP